MSDPTAILSAGVSEGLHPGAQLFALLDGKVVFDFACGEASPSVPMRTDSIVQWFSSGKPLTAICIAQLYEAGELLFEDRVARFIPEFGTKGKEPITLFHLLTHTAGFCTADNVPKHIPWEQSIQQICDTPAESNWVPGQKAGYSTQAAWFLLAEVIQRITKVPFPEYIRTQLLEPLGMSDSWLKLSPERRAAYGDQVAQMFETMGGRKSLAPLQDAAGMDTCRPGASARGPVKQLARFYSMLLNGGELDGVRIVRPETVKLSTQRQRTGLFDHTFMHTIDVGLGFIINSNRYGVDTVPYGYGRYASEETFGHSGAQSSCAFADRKHNLVVAWVANGMPGERAHQKRQREVNNAIYEGLGLQP